MGKAASGDIQSLRANFIIADVFIFQGFRLETRNHCSLTTYIVNKWFLQYTFCLHYLCIPSQTSRLHRWRKTPYLYLPFLQSFLYLN